MTVFHRNERALIVAAHPDDEVLGCGGTIARLTQAGATSKAIFMTDGLGARGARAAADQQRRRDGAMAAAAALGMDPPAFGEFPDNQLDTVPLLDLVQHIEAASRAFRPTIIVTHSGSDLNIDHSVVHRATLTAFRPLPASSIRLVLAFEIPSSTEWSSPSVALPFHPDSFVDISSSLDQKLAALMHYSDELRPFPHPRSIDGVTALARHRGASVGVAAAEAFVTVRAVI